MSDEIFYERISEKNFDDFLYLINKLAEYEKLDPPSKDGIKRLKNAGLSRNPKYFAYLVRLNKKLIGYIIYFFTYSSFVTLPTFYLEDIFILEEYRHKKIGRQMFQFCINIAKEKGCGRMEWCVLNWNKPAIKFYEKYNPQRLTDWYYYRLNKDQIDNLAK